MQVLLRDHDANLVRAWREAFHDVEAVTADVADYFDEPADAMVSPANSFGFMDGGLDLAIRNTLGLDVERRVRAAIEERHHGELPVGVAEVVPTDDPRWPWLICAPTMRVPEDVSRTVHAYWAFRAILLAARRIGARSLLCPGLATGVGRMPPRRCATQMRQAWFQVSSDAKPPSFQHIHQVHQTMRLVD